MKTLLTTTTALLLGSSLAFAASHGGMGVHFMENWDLNEDGQVSLEEATERRSDVFYMFDEDENGLLDSAEYDLFDETRKADQEANGASGTPGRNSPANGMKREFTDTNGDGKVTRDEFLNTVPAWYAKVDRNGDGTVTTDDFGRRKN